MVYRCALALIAVLLVDSRLLLAKCEAPTAGVPRSYPNIILIVADDLGWSELPYFNPPVVGDPRRGIKHDEWRPDLNRYAARSLAIKPPLELDPRSEDLDGNPLFAIDLKSWEFPAGAPYVHGTASGCAAQEISPPCDARMDLLGGLRMSRAPDGSLSGPFPGLGGLRRIAEGSTFSRFYAAASVCSPSRASILTGRRVGGSGATESNAFHASTGIDSPMSTREVTIAEYLKQGCGAETCFNPPCATAPCYQTALFGKWHIGRTDGRAPWDQGFDRFVGFTTGDRDPFSEEPLVCKGPVEGCVDMPGGQDGGRYDVPTSPGQDQRTVTCNDDGKTKESHCNFQDRIFRDLAAEFVEDQERTQGADSQAPPYFLMVAFHSPHDNTGIYSAPARTARHYETGGFKPKEPRTQTVADFWALVEEIDFAVGEILDKAGPNTLVMFTSDNGRPAELGVYGRPTLQGGKGTALEGGIRVGLLARACELQSVGPRLHLDKFVAGHADIFPTIAEAVGFNNYASGFCFAGGDYVPCTQCIATDGTCLPGCDCATIPGHSFFQVINRRAGDGEPASKPPFAVSRYGDGNAIIMAPGSEQTPEDIRKVCGRGDPELPQGGSCVPCTEDADCRAHSVRCRIFERVCRGDDRVCSRSLSPCNYDSECPPPEVCDYPIGGPCAYRWDCPNSYDWSCRKNYWAKCDTCIEPAWKLRRKIRKVEQFHDTRTNPKGDSKLECKELLPAAVEQIAAVLNDQVGFTQPTPTRTGTPTRTPTP